MRTSKYDESNASALEDPTLQAGNPIKEIRRRCYVLIPDESDSLPHAHAQTTKTHYTHQDSRIKKAKDQSKTNTLATLIFKIFLKDIKIIKTKIVKGD
ncbi:hypothetical protein Tco_0290620 [Tanacetum coccineum]